MTDQEIQNRVKDFIEKAKKDAIEKDGADDSTLNSYCIATVAAEIAVLMRKECTNKEMIKNRNDTINNLMKTLKYIAENTYDLQARDEAEDAVKEL